MYHLKGTSSTETLNNKMLNSKSYLFRCSFLNGIYSFEQNIIALKVSLTKLCLVFPQSLN